MTSASALTSALSGSAPVGDPGLGHDLVLGHAHASRRTRPILGASGAKLVGCGLNIKNAKNVIVRNLTFDDWDDDAINVETSTNVWIDHNTFFTGYDGSVDTKRGSDYVTISWNHFDGQDKNSLVGHSDDNGSQDRGKLRVTYHHNWFDGTNQRNPRVRFGNPVHVFNNLYYSASGRTAWPPRWRVVSWSRATTSRTPTTPSTSVRARPRRARWWRATTLRQLRRRPDRWLGEVDPVLLHARHREHGEVDRELGRRRTLSTRPDGPRRSLRRGPSLARSLPGDGGRRYCGQRLGG